jgi:hypothetical protein
MEEEKYTRRACTHKYQKGNEMAFLIIRHRENCGGVVDVFPELGYGICRACSAEICFREGAERFLKAEYFPICEYVKA